MRLISAAPRGVAANCRSSATVCGTAVDDRLERAKRVRVGEGQDFVGVHGAGPLRQRGQQIGRGNQHGTRLGHSETVYIWLSGHLVIWSLIVRIEWQTEIQ